MIHRMGADSRDNSGVVAPPPLIYGAGIALGLAAYWLAPLPLLACSRVSRATGSAASACPISL